MIPLIHLYEVLEEQKVSCGGREVRVDCERTKE